MHDAGPQLLELPIEVGGRRRQNWVQPGKVRGEGARQRINRELPVQIWPNRVNACTGGDGALEIEVVPVILATAPQVSTQEMQIGEPCPGQPLQRVDELALGSAGPER
jgi:hypothetical protein